MEGDGLRSVVGGDTDDAEEEEDENEDDDETENDDDAVEVESEDDSETQNEDDNESEVENEDEVEDDNEDENDDENDDENEDEDSENNERRRRWTDSEQTIDSGCTDIDECSLETHNCDTEANCNNTIGSFECKCKDDYVGDGITCSVLDACEV